MAISAPSRPELIVTGKVLGSREARKKADQTVYAHDARIETATATLYVRFWLREGDVDVNTLVGQDVSIVVTVNDSKTYWAELAFVRLVTDKDLDRVVSAAKVLDSVK